ncbi:DNA repair protein RecO [Modicisalibacter luteus]|uniref:DNA repair protein RecO n=1 Tax=Modicisalibacter luteus TaxID=453962 RepID=A0ABV7M5N7_9GAMM|nr:DNA repair protein RecO [Halomonas lutea]GHA89327.1 DNA repair protein RecO [Halomonas lutea]
MQPQPAYLLHKRPYRETSALIELITLDHGRVRAVAQGVQRAGSKSRSRLQPFAPLHVTWTGTNDLKRLRLMESRGASALLAGEGLLCGLYANELLSRVLPAMFPVPEVFAFYASLMEELPVPERRAPGLRRLELAVLEALDADPVFRDLHDRELDHHGRYVYRAGSRRFVMAPEGQIGVDGRSLRLLEQGDWTQPGLAGVAKVLTRAALSPLLGDKPLRSRELMYQLAARRRPS